MQPPLCSVPPTAARSATGRSACMKAELFGCTVLEWLYKLIERTKSLKNAIPRRSKVRVNRYRCYLNPYRPGTRCMRYNIITGIHTINYLFLYSVSNRISSYIHLIYCYYTVYSNPNSNQQTNTVRTIITVCRQSVMVRRVVELKH